MNPASLPRSLGSFRIDAVLGEGGSGVVYDATWGPRRVALKVVHESLAGSERLRAQFLSEAQRLQTIAHPSVVKVFAVGELPDGRPYLAMERLEGETLAQVLARGPLSIATALELFAELCAAVATLHDQGLVHRDLKPENVFIVGEPQAPALPGRAAPPKGGAEVGVHAVLLDFGIAKELAAPASTTTMDGGVRGTPAYMAPERFFGQPAGVATDIYELAVILYAMLAGRLPWDDLADPEARLSPRPLVELAPVPDELDVEIRRALSTRAQNRPAAALALRDAVVQAAGADGPKTAAETARMRPDALAPQPTAERTPWFAERQNTTDRGETPLAWMPTQLAPPPPAPPRRTRARYLAGGAAIIAIAGGAAAWRLASDDEAAPVPVAAPVTPVAVAPAPPPVADDPWDVPTQAAPKQAPPIAVTGAEPSVAKVQAELDKALGYLPADTTVILAATVGPLRRDERVGQLVDKLRDAPQAELLAMSVPPCARALVAVADWAIVGSPGFDAALHGTLIVGGRFVRDDVERCFEVAGRLEQHVFLDDHTLYVTMHDGADKASLARIAKHPPGLRAGMRAQLAALPRDRSLTFAVDGTNDLSWPSDTIPDGSDAWGWLRTGKDKLALAIELDVKELDAAELLEADVRAPLATLFAGATEASGKLVVTRDRTKVKISGSLSWLMMSMVGAALK